MKLRKVRKLRETKPISKPLKVWNDPLLNQSEDTETIAYLTDDVAEQIRIRFAGLDDIQHHRVEIDQMPMLIVWINSLVQPSAVKDFIFLPLLNFPQSTPLNQILKQVENLSNITCVTFAAFTKELLQGSVAIIMGGIAYMCQIGTTEGRSVDRSYLEPSLLGPQDAFVESIETNIGQIRMRLRSLRLKVQKFSIGTVSPNEVTMLFLDGITKPEYVVEITNRIKKVQTDVVLDVNYMEEWIGDGKYTPFPTVQKTERPDRAVGSLLEGKIVILSDGSPLALIVPAVFVDFMTASEDYYEKYIFAFPIRVLRHMYYWISLLLPAIYVALLSFQQEMIPTSLLKSFISSREGIPFPVIVEALIMEVTFEVLREAGLRLPKTVGQSVSIVGALVIGEAAVQASIVSPVMVIIVSVTGIASFSVPSYSLGLTNRILRFPIMLLAAFFGLYGVTMAVLVILAHMATLKSFDKPYMAPIAPFNWAEMKDTFFRAPWWALKNADHGHNEKIFTSDNVE